MIGRIKKHALDRLDFAGDVSAAKRLSACKTFIRLESAMIRMRHEAGASGREVARGRATMIDVLLSHLFQYACDSWRHAHGTEPLPVCLVAIGGYGRGELSPHSDIDIMFLFPSEVGRKQLEPFQEHLVNEILYILWDCGLKIGHSSRTVDEVFAEARNDIQTKTALLETRRLAGSESLYETFASAYRSFSQEDNPRDYLTRRLNGQRERRARYGQTVFLQEPDIKNGVGGLRDYHNILWMARVKLGIDQLDDLVAQDYLRPGELRDINRAYDFLLRVRNELHFNSRHATDLLNLESQPRIAFGLGYVNDDPLARVEQFMHDYYHAAQTIHRTARNLENRLALTLEPPSRLSLRDTLRISRHQKTKRIDGFIHRGKELVASSPDIFKADPARLIRVFRHCQQLDAQPDFALQNLIRGSLPLITRHVINSPDAIVSFRSILQEAGAVFPILDLMHELGVLGRFIPEFDGLTCRVQHEFYHRYTADIHTLNAIRELDAIFNRLEPITHKYLAALHETPNPTLLYLILLLHDIGKAVGIKGHADTGAELALPVLRRLGVGEADCEIVVFIIKQHLIMARFWQRHDVDDPKTASIFAEALGDANRLRYLYVHTYCDARGTSTDLWNSYKDTLHTTLYRATLEHLIHGGEAIETKNSGLTQMKRQELLAKKIPGIGSDEITAHFNLLPERYFIHTGTDEISLHLEMVNRLLRSINTADSIGTLRPIIDWKNDLNRGLTVVNVVTWDRAGLFYKLAGAFSVAGLNILGAKVISRADHIAIDTFYVVEPGGGAVENHGATEVFARTVEQALVANRDLYPDILAQAKKVSQRYGLDLKNGMEALQSAFPPSIEVYHELAMQRTIVEIQARDHLGLLYQLSKSIYDHGFDITFARIGTERGIAIDTFYIESTDGEQIDETRLHTLRDALHALVAPEQTSEAPAA
ncbi:[protein-PII] uridylyltransferase [Termitidicoccus mucosus]|uniref:Bifunctional uridylyltransferase/uridylyl-removing enzyme n=1 Tax=Termitidicoccus mucosus TaxID=1184151 RepID=A0A178IDI6_9BACT|nr:uridylyltransferase [Opitutaceae bacterium TSB47]